LRTILYKLSDLGTGDSIGEVYFRLGNPNKVEGNTYTWFPVLTPFRHFNTSRLQVDAN